MPECNYGLKSKKNKLRDRYKTTTPWRFCAQKI